MVEKTPPPQGQLRSVCFTMDVNTYASYLLFQKTKVEYLFLIRLFDILHYIEKYTLANASSL